MSSSVPAGFLFDWKNSLASATCQRFCAVGGRVSCGRMDTKVKNTFIHVDDGEDGELVPRLEELS